MAGQCLIKLIRATLLEDPLSRSRVVNWVRRCSVGAQVSLPKPKSAYQADCQQPSPFSSDRMQHKLYTEQSLWPTICTLLIHKRLTAYIFIVTFTITVRRLLCHSFLHFPFVFYYLSQFSYFIQRLLFSLLQVWYLVTLNAASIWLSSAFSHANCSKIKNAKGICLSLVFGIRYGNWRRKSTHSNVFAKYVEPTPRKK